MEGSHLDNTPAILVISTIMSRTKGVKEFMELQEFKERRQEAVPRDALWDIGFLT
jgi:hypothetical protein